MGMSYSLVAAEMLIAPGMPSCTARAGMLMPVSEAVQPFKIAPFTLRTPRISPDQTPHGACALVDTVIA
eukprot:1161593-Pelagomonas_calceolata.AAC.8